MKFRGAADQTQTFSFLINLPSPPPLPFPHPSSSILLRRHLLSNVAVPLRRYFVFQFYRIPTPLDFRVFHYFGKNFHFNSSRHLKIGSRFDKISVGGREKGWGFSLEFEMIIVSQYNDLICKYISRGLVSACLALLQVRLWLWLWNVGSCQWGAYLYAIRV